MANLRVTGGHKISGEILISGAKNSSMPILVASTLIKGAVTLSNIPYVKDVTTLLSLLSSIGTKISILGDTPVSKTLRLQTENLLNISEINPEANKIRTSVLLMGACLTRNGYFKLSKPGGCNIGERKIDFHISGMKALGAHVIETETFLELTTYGKRLCGAEITFPNISVGATENIIMAAVLAKGSTILRNVAVEPEIQDLICFLKKAGAKISENIEKREITIEGVDELHESEHYIIPDRVEALTYILMSAATEGELVLKNVSVENLGPVVQILKEIGISIQDVDSEYHFGSVASCNVKQISPFNIETAPFPGFATDLQPQMMVLLLKANGISEITENIFENRFQHVHHLNKMGANIQCNGRKAIIENANNLIGGEVEGTDLRACAALTMAGLIASGETIIKNIENLDRGYYNFTRNISNCGGILQRLY